MRLVYILRNLSLAPRLHVSKSFFLCDMLGDWVYFADDISQPPPPKTNGPSKLIKTQIKILTASNERFGVGRQITVT